MLREQIKLIIMDLLSQKVERAELKPGDHIYTWRKQIYSHHGIFIGEGEIIHFVDVKSDNLLHFSSFVGSSSGDGKMGSSSGDGKKKKKTRCPNLGCFRPEIVAGSGVRKSCIDCFIKKGSLYLFKYNASREFVILKLRGGTCTTAISDPPEEVVRRATYLYENGYERYDVMNNNCEDFALYCKTSLWSNDKYHQGRSSQANMIRRTSPANEKGEIGMFLHRISTAIPRSFTKREHKDLGVRDDVVKVSVEDLSSFVRTLK